MEKEEFPDLKNLTPEQRRAYEGQMGEVQRLSMRLQELAENCREFLAARCLLAEFEKKYGSLEFESATGLQTDSKPLEPESDTDPDLKEKYQMLSRLESDCKYFLGNGNRHTKHLYYEDVTKQIEEMKRIYNSFPEEARPEWISYADIEAYEKRMTNQEETPEQKQFREKEMENKKPKLL